MAEASEQNFPVCEDLYKTLERRVLAYHPSQDMTMIRAAYELAAKAHCNQFRESGEPYLIHPMSTAIILAELELDMESIAAGILHDVIEDTDYSYDDIVRLFGDEVAQLVDGVTKLAKISFVSKETEQANNYRKMFLAMAKDIRVIIIKIADRLHNLRTLKYRPPEKQRSVAQETMDIYAPLAHRLGMADLRYEMEDICFKYLNPEAYFDLAEKINTKLSERRAFVDKITREIKERLAAEGIACTVEGRPKHFFSIYKKMVSQNKTLDQIYDLFAVRVIVELLRDCYEVLGVVHEMYKPVPGRFKDYIGMPKANNYQSLHTTLIYPGEGPFEVQIRTMEMHRTAAYGIAAHWKYKEGAGGKISEEKEEAKLTWLREILEWQRDLDDKEYLDALKGDLDVFRNHVYCFTPKGDVISLINGSTPIDFAYAIHSAVGNKMVGARVNGRIVNIDYQLQTGDSVEVITSQNSAGPGRDWLKLVKSSQARNKINQWFKQENREENILRGRELLEKEAKRKGLAMSELLAGGREESTLSRYTFPDWDTLCAAIGYGGLKESQVVNRLEEEYLAAVKEAEVPEIVIDTTDTTARDRKKKSGIYVKGVGDINVRFSKCCTPVPGDEIVGFVTRGRGVSIHRTDCVNIINLDELDRKRLLDAEWQLPEKGVEGIHYQVELRIICDDSIGLWVDITRVITDNKIVVKSMHTKLANRETIVNITIEITSREQLDHICEKLQKLSCVHEIERVTT
ncbi:MAG: bifunctional (p)ppGpp synthetase/guanosine-3',5'-bis(diphosphate) 3'-pyrophosphohydrolase [Defluviitaleaceae bacterium]|nr:bifunctional (p)ppGpp synthetase/guanosine-3',5'-bis(diphosphate) 3'-pyrophosphohydrolase [Defluviitaleaceae bacterium]